MIRAAGYVRGRPDQGRVVSFRSSTQALDRHGTIIKPEGIRTENYRKNPIFLWGHDGYGGLVGAPQLENVIGRTIKMKSTKDGFDHDVEFAPEEANPKAEMALRLVDSGFLNSTSIGFNPIRIASEKINGQDVPVFEEVDLLEVSLVPIPSNPEAGVALGRAFTNMSAGARGEFSHLLEWLARERQDGRPDPGEFDDKDSFMNACVPVMVEEGRERDQAVAACSSMWDNRSVDPGDGREHARTVTGSGFEDMIRTIQAHEPRSDWLTEIRARIERGSHSG